VFYLCTNRSNPDSAQELFVDDLAALQNSNFDYNAPVKVVVHGFSSTSIGGASGTVKNGKHFDSE
jgi:hypothetical protein